MIAIKSDDLNNKLWWIRNFQQHCPNSMIGGSIGLLIHGFWVGRDLTGTDLDVTTPFLPKEGKLASLDQGRWSDRNQSGCDFDYSVKLSGFIFKVDFAIESQNFVSKTYTDGHRYNLTHIGTIIKAKEKYAWSGSDKHQQDLEYLCKEYPKAIRPLLRQRTLDLIDKGRTSTGTFKQDYMSNQPSLSNQNHKHGQAAILSATPTTVGHGQKFAGRAIQSKPSKATIAVGLIRNTAITW